MIETKKELEWFLMGIIIASGNDKFSMDIDNTDSDDTMLNIKTE